MAARLETIAAKEENLQPHIIKVALEFEQYIECL